MKRPILVHLLSSAPRSSSLRALRRLATVAVAVALPAGACKGPEPEQRNVALNIPDQSAMVIQWPDGPRRPNAELVMQKSAEDYAGQLFQGEPMPRALTPEAAAAAQPAAPTGEGTTAGDDAAAVDPGESPKPAWADGVPKPPEVAENDMPRAWPIEVKLGETPALLAQWSNGDGKQIVADNEEMLGKRKWLKTGDRISVTMTANQKIAFDRARDAYQKQRVDAFFTRRYFEKVIVYRVKKGEYISAAAKRYGDVPLWLIEEFNQMDFRGLQPGDEILIPIISALEPGQAAPPPLVVVDEEGHPISDARQANIDSRLKGDFMARARLALDDSNVFMRARPFNGVGGAGGAGSPGAAMGDPSYAAVAPADVNPAGMGMNAAAPSARQLPAASIGSHDLLPEYRIGPPQVDRAAAPQAFPTANGAAQGGGSAVAPAMPDGQLTLRDVVVKRGESLLHYVKWSKSSLDTIKSANPHLDPQRIFVGARVAIPMTDVQYVAFVKARASWEKESDDTAQDGSGSQAPAAKPQPKKHTVKAGETGTSIARKYKIAVKALKAANPKANLKKLKPGSKLVIPEG